jgi:manganese transport protein
MSNIMALLQSLSADLELLRNVTWRASLRETYSPFINYILYFLAEIAIAVRSCRGFRNGNRYQFIV